MAAETALSVITSEVEIKGTIKSTGSVQLDGKLDGDLVCEGDALLGKTASLKGTITANSVVVEGTVNGSITAKDKIAMKSTANMRGDIKAKRLSVEDGVTFVGKCDVNPSGASEGKGESDIGDAKPPFLGKSKSFSL